MHIKFVTVVPWVKEMENSNERQDQFQPKFFQVLGMALKLGGNSETGFASKEQILVFDLFKALDQIESSQKSDIFFLENTYFPAQVRNMF